MSRSLPGVAAGKLHRIDYPITIRIDFLEEWRLTKVFHLASFRRPLGNPLTARFIELRLTDAPVSIQIEFFEGWRPSARAMLG
jgi:hypothetical protein